jgi:hypothetical protein
MLKIFVATGLLMATPAASAMIWGEGAGGIDCLRLLAQAYRGPGAKTDITMMYTPLNGRTLDEASAKIMHLNYVLPQIIDHALEHANLSPSERDLLLRIRFSLGYENRLTNLVFISARQYPEYFKNAGSHRIAATGNNVGDPIYINTDQIRELSLSDSVALLIHEFSHHHGMRDEEFRILDSLGHKVASTLQADSQSLAEIGLKHFRFEQFYLDMAQTPASTFEQAVGMSPGHLHDRGFGTHFIISDGLKSHDIRELFRQDFEYDDSKSGAGLIHIRLSPIEWVITKRPVMTSINNQTIEVVDALVIKVDVVKLIGNEVNAPFEVILPIVKDESGEWRFQDNKVFNPYVKNILTEQADRTSVLSWLWREVPLGFVQDQAISNSMSVIQGTSNTRVEAEFDYIPGLQIFSQVDLAWVQEHHVGGKVMRSMIRADNQSMVRFSRNHYQLEEVSPGKYKFSVTLHDDHHNVSTDLKLASLFFWKNGAGVIAVTPQIIPTYRSRHSSGGLANSIAPLRSVPGSKTLVKMSRNPEDYVFTHQGYLERFSIDFEVPDDFDLSTLQSAPDVKALFKFPDRNYAPFGIALTASTLVRFDAGFDLRVENGKNILTASFNMYLFSPMFNEGYSIGLPSEIEISGFTVQGRDLRMHHLDHPLKLSFE